MERGMGIKVKALGTLAFLLVLIGSSTTVSAAIVTESTGPNGYGWQQKYTDTSPYYRVTGSADRQYYDWGYKQISISGRREQYWHADCGWWYVSGESNLDINMTDAAGDTLVIGSNIATTKGQTGEQSYTWGADDDPGRWTVTVGGPTIVTQFYIYVRGQLNVTQITTSGTLQTGNLITIQATLKDNANNLVTGSATDNTGTSVVPTVTAYVSGAGENFEVALSDGDNDGVWTGTFTPQKPGDHKITVKASGGHQYWVDGRGSTTVPISGSFPYGIGVGSGSMLKVLFMIFTAWFLLRHPRAAPLRKAMVLLIMMGVSR